MKTKKLSFDGLKNVLTKAEMKNIMAGSDNCILIGGSCNANLQCCSVHCVEDSSDPVTGKTCQAS